ncbi:Pentatricopeptide repeat-containing protein [Thalictrum thalictroides]|uniref:Pentatricopeptide repeat-containing protein n=1 Tax=Thalictrum thalictroides TaxID=46969 RepID=A0A7J6W1B5_THATH|nr:Pentatricopeptide repeat-containing protein [Thalictrum thalictroides]
MLLNPHSKSRALQQYLFSLLQSCRTTRELIQIHAQIVVNDLSQKNYILAKLLSFCIESGDINHAYRAFQQIETPSTILWNQMIRGYARSETPQESIQLYNEMYRVEAETEADGFTYSFALNACARLNFLREGEQLHGRILVNGLCSNVYVQTNLVNMYAVNGGVSKARGVFDEMTQRSVVTWNSMLVGYLRSGCMDEARKVFDEMPERNVVSWTTMIAGCVQKGRCKQALALFREMWRAGVEVDGVTMVAALSACAELGDLKTGTWIHSFVDKTLQFRNQPQSVSLNNALIHMYASCGLIEEAYKVFKQMKRRSVVSWTTMITGFAKQGLGQEALSVFRWMQNLEDHRVRPDELTFLGVLCACSHTGMVDEGRHYFQYMIQSCGIEPKIEHYGCMVDLLSRAGLLDEAHTLIETMPMKPNDALWGALLGGCRIHKNIELASQVAHQLATELDPDLAAGYLVLLSNVYAAAKRWAEVSSVRQRMVEKGVKKPPGRSWIQVDGVINDFVAGDWTHKNSSAIYEMVGRITMEAKLEEQMLELPEVLLNVGREDINVSPSLVIT